MEKFNTPAVERDHRATEQLLESVENAKDFYEALKEFEGTDVVGAEALEEVEGLTRQLKESLRDIPPAVRMAEGLPYHPHENLQQAA